MTDDLSKIWEMKYSGRMLHAITTIDGEFGVGYTVTGRSPSSQARRFVVGKNTGTISVQPVNDEASLRWMFPKETSTKEGLEKLMRDTSQGSSALIYYPAVRPVRDHEGKLIGVVASNGVQTDLIYSAFNQEMAGDEILCDAFHRPHIMYDPQFDRDVDITEHEPDHPNNTPRINLCYKIKNNLGFSLSIINKEEGHDGRHMVAYNPFSVKGSILSLPTYLGGNEKPLKSFTGELLISRSDARSAQDICERLYRAVGPKDGNNYRVAAGVTLVKNDGSLEIATINRAVIGV